MTVQTTITQDIPEQVAAEAMDLARQSLDKMRPYLHALTPDDRKLLPKVSDGTEAFLSKGIDYLEANRQLAPAYLDVNMVKVDYHVNEVLIPFKALMDEYCSLVSDTKMLAASEAYTGVLSYYNCVKEAARRRIPGAKMIFEDLKKRFEKKKKKEGAATETKKAGKDVTVVA